MPIPQAGNKQVKFLLFGCDDDAGEPLIVLERLKNLEEMLPAGQFLRVHRSYIVNLARIRATAAGEITLDDGTHIPVGDSYRDKFRKMTIFGKTQ